MLRLFQVDAFADQLFAGNPAAVVPLESWPVDSLLQSIAMENNLAETAFMVPIDRDKPAEGFELRWFTPVSEVALCGHATLATAHVLIKHLGYPDGSIQFFTRESGVLTVTQDGAGQLSMSFPSIPLTECNDSDAVAEALGAPPVALYSGHYSTDQLDYVAKFNSEAEVKRLKPELLKIGNLKSRGVIATAAGNDCDFVSRYFAPNYGVDEDPVTGSAHCLLTPHWARVLDKPKLTARQVSARGGFLGCELQDDRTIITGRCVDYLVGQINLTNS